MPRSITNIQEAGASKDASKIAIENRRRIRNIVGNAPASADSLPEINQKSPDEYTFNSGRTDSYTEDGSVQRPFKTLAKFASSILTSTPRKITVRLVGSFTLADTITINHANWDITIIGGNISITPFNTFPSNCCSFMAWDTFAKLTTVDSGWSSSPKALFSLISSSYFLASRKSICFG